MTATGAGDLISYEWKFANKIIEGETSDTLVINDIGLDQAGLYSVTAKNFNSSNRKSKRITVSKRENEVLVIVGSTPVAVVASSDNHPGGEHAGLAIDNDSSTKYLNFDGANDTPSGLTITSAGGVVTSLGLTSANDAPDRDPATFVLSGSNDGGATFTEIASGAVPAFTDRFERQEVTFCLLYTSPSPRDQRGSRMPSSA